VARAILLAGGLAWVLAAGMGLTAALIGIDAVEALLPPLAIESDALARTVAALAVGALLVGGVHLVVAAGLARNRPWATSAGVLLSAVSVAGFVALAAAAVTAGAAASLAAIAATATAIGSLLVAGAYAAVGVALARRLRSGRLV
jgi:hypothetical protein